jgi:hypothetical protein
VESAEIEMLVNELETRVDRLRALYEQYFMGIERLIPAVPHKDVERRVYVLRKEQIRNTAVRFRFQMLLQRYNTYQTHWQRVCRQIEEGTYKRHRLRAERRFNADEAAIDVSFSSVPPPIVEPIPPEPPTKPVQVHTLALDDIGDLDAILNAPVAPVKKGPPPLPPKKAPPAPVAAVAPPPPAATAAPKPRPAWRKVENTAGAPVAAAAPVAPAPVAPAPAAPAPAPQKPPAPAPVAAVKPSPADLPDQRVRQLYSQYVQTRRAQNESTAAITYDAMAKSLRESSAKLREKHGKSVDFEVTVKDGKTILKPVVKSK